METYLVYRTETGRIVNITVGNPKCPDGLAALKIEEGVTAGIGDRIIFDGSTTSFEYGDGLETVDDALVAVPDEAEDI